jgi:hypothetical protein
MTPAWFRRDIIRPVSPFEHEAVSHAQRVMRCEVTGEMDESTVSHLRAMQSLFGLRTSGYLDLETAKQIERIRVYGSVEG